MRVLSVTGDIKLNNTTSFPMTFFTIKLVEQSIDNLNILNNIEYINNYNSITNKSGIKEFKEWYVVKRISDILELNTKASKILIDEVLLLPENLSSGNTLEERSACIYDFLTVLNRHNNNSDIRSLLNRFFDLSNQLQPTSNITNVDNIDREINDFINKKPVSVNINQGLMSKRGSLLQDNGGTPNVAQRRTSNNKGNALLFLPTHRGISKTPSHAKVRTYSFSSHHNLIDDDKKGAAYDLLENTAVMHRLSLQLDDMMPIINRSNSVFAPDTVVKNEVSSSNSSRVASPPLPPPPPSMAFARASSPETTSALKMSSIKMVSGYFKPSKEEILNRAISPVKVTTLRSPSISSNVNLINTSIKIKDSQATEADPFDFDYMGSSNKKLDFDEQSLVNSNCYPSRHKNSMISQSSANQHVPRSISIDEEEESEVILSQSTPILTVISKNSLVDSLPKEILLDERNIEKNNPFVSRQSYIPVLNKKISNLTIPENFSGAPRVIITTFSPKESKTLKSPPSHIPPLPQSNSFSYPSTEESQKQVLPALPSDSLDLMASSHVKDKTNRNSLPPIPILLEENIMRKYTVDRKVNHTNNHFAESLAQEPHDREIFANLYSNPLFTNNTPISGESNKADFPTTAGSDRKISVSKSRRKQASTDVSYEWMSSLASHFDAKSNPVTEIPKETSKRSSVTALSMFMLSKTNFRSIDFICLYIGLMMADVAQSSSYKTLVDAISNIKMHHFGVNMVYASGASITGTVAKRRLTLSSTEQNQNSLAPGGVSTNKDVFSYLSEASYESPNHPWLKELIEILKLPQTDKTATESRLVKLLYFINISLYNDDNIDSFECQCPGVCSSCVIRLLWPFQAFNTFKLLLHESVNATTPSIRAIIQSSVIMLVYRLMHLRSKMLSCYRYEVLDILPTVNRAYSFLEFCTIVIDLKGGMGPQVFNTLAAIMNGELNSDVSTKIADIASILQSNSFSPTGLFSSRIFHGSMLHTFIKSFIHLSLRERVDCLKNLNLFALRGHGNCEIILNSPPGWRMSLLSLLHDVPSNLEQLSLYQELLNYILNLFVVIFYDIYFKWSNIFNVLESFISEIVQFASWNQYTTRFVRSFFTAIFQVIFKHAIEVKNQIYSHAWYNTLMIVGVAYEFIFFSANLEWRDFDYNRIQLYMPRIRKLDLPSVFSKSNTIKCVKFEQALPEASPVSKVTTPKSRISYSVQTTGNTLEIWKTKLKGLIELRLDLEGTGFLDLNLLNLICNLLKSLGFENEYNESSYPELNKPKLRIMKTLHGVSVLSRKILETLQLPLSKFALVQTLDELLRDPKMKRYLERMQNECLNALNLETNISLEGTFMCSSSRGESEYSFFLTNKKLMFCSGSKPENITSNMESIEILALNDIHVNTDSLAHLGYSHSFGISTSDLSFLINCKSQQVCDKWKLTLLDAIHNSENSPEYNIYQTDDWNDTTFTCAFWVPNDHCSMCKQCKTTFSVFNRRHHCRGCGHLFCGDCCSFKWRLNLLDPVNPVKVCKFCYEDLKEQHDQKLRKFAELYGNRADPTGIPGLSSPVRDSITKKNLNNFLTHRPSIDYLVKSGIISTEKTNNATKAI